ncbi:GNAT family N-acetyltransferase [Streptomyces sp. NPDC059534]|uniref:GNAT family N-acetyltransferase n=1 Tax=Streptomyces sp. NPDC059534 TaxID=3346859 RepID=UPI0036BA7AC9
MTLTQPRPLLDVDAELTLRAFDAEADLAEFFQVIEESLDHLRPWMPWVQEHSLARATAFLDSRVERWASGWEFTYAVVLDGAIVGSCGLHRYEDTEAGTLEIGYWLHPSATGRGVATRAARALTDEAFLLPDVDCVEIVHDAANHASGAVPARLGFTDTLRPSDPTAPRAPAETGEDRVWRLSR